MKHPEQLEGEIFLTNAWPEPRESWEGIGWKSKRRGRVAYDIKDNPLKNGFPVFITVAEVEAEIATATDPNTAAIYRRLLGEAK